jgi:lipoate-protein ligase A
MNARCQTYGAVDNLSPVNTQWLYSIEPELDGPENMARDEAMAQACNADGIPRLRLYSWYPWTLSLGYNQNDKGIDPETVQSNGYGLVRRPTGGRAVFHAEEITYAVAMPSGGAGIHETYARITAALRRGLELLGVQELEFSRSQPDFREHYMLEESASCFSASALNELTWRGRKLLGSAQRRYGNVLLQHGSLLLGDAHLGIIDLLHAHAEESRRMALRKRLAERTATLSQLIDNQLPAFTAIADALCLGFAETFGAEMILQPGDHSPSLVTQHGAGSPNHTLATPPIIDRSFLHDQ